jgi:hypothetical protein
MLPTCTTCWWRTKERPFSLNRRRRRSRPRTYPKALCVILFAIDSRFKAIINLDTLKSVPLLHY